MITATFRADNAEGEISLVVKGHAGQAEVGKDIVCASASILTYTFASIVRSYEDQLAREPIIRLESGDSTVLCKCRDYDTYHSILNALHYTEAGYALLESEYPQYVRLKEAFT